MKEILFKELNLREKLIFIVFKKYSYKIYSIGTKEGYNWCNKTN